MSPEQSLIQSIEQLCEDTIKKAEAVRDVVAAGARVVYKAEVRGRMDAETEALKWALLDYKESFGGRRTLRKTLRNPQ